MSIVVQRYEIAIMWAELRAIEALLKGNYPSRHRWQRIAEMLFDLRIDEMLAS